MRARRNPGFVLLRIVSSLGRGLHPPAYAEEDVHVGHGARAQRRRSTPARRRIGVAHRSGRTARRRAGLPVDAASSGHPREAAPGSAIASAGYRSRDRPVGPDRSRDRPRPALLSRGRGRARSGPTPRRSAAPRRGRLSASGGICVSSRVCSSRWRQIRRMLRQGGVRDVLSERRRRQQPHPLHRLGGGSRLARPRRLRFANGRRCRVTRAQLRLRGDAS